MLSSFFWNQPAGVSDLHVFLLTAGWRRAKNKVAKKEKQPKKRTIARLAMPKRPLPRHRNRLSRLKPRRLHPTSLFTLVVTPLSHAKRFTALQADLSLSFWTHDFYGRLCLTFPLNCQHCFKNIYTPNVKKQDSSLIIPNNPEEVF